MGAGMADQDDQEVEEEHAGQEVKVEQQRRHLHLRGVHGGGGELVDGDGDVDGDYHETVQPGERPRQGEECRLGPGRISLSERS